MTTITLTIITCAITAVIGGVIGIMFNRVEKKIDKVAEDNERHHQETLEVRVAERELLLAEARISALTARCVRGEKVNGDLEKAETELEDKEKNVQAMMTRFAVNMELRS